MDTEQPQPVLPSLWRLWPFARPHALWIGIGAVTSVINAGMSLAIAYLLKHLLDTALAEDLDAFLAYVWQMVGVALVLFVTQFIHPYALDRFANSTNRDVRNLITGCIQRIPASYLVDKHSGDLVSRMNNDTGKIFTFLRNMPDMLHNPFLLIGSLTYLIILSWKLVAAALILLPVIAFFSNKMSKPIAEQSKALQESYGEANAAALDITSGIAMVKAYTLEPLLSKRYEDVITKVMGHGIRLLRTESLWGTVNSVLNISLTLLLPLYGVVLVMDGELTVGGFVASIMLMGNMAGPATALNNLFREFRETAPAADRFWEIVDHEPESPGDAPFMPDTESPPVSLDNVSFQYRDDHPVLTDLSMVIARGRTTALAGVSGSGKSTVLKLICGLYRPTEGEVSIYGRDLSSISLTEVRKHMSLVTQETYLFPRTVFENISFGRENASREEVVNAAKMANAHDFIEALEHGYDTLVGERGVRFSGGQQQRIAIARALLKDAPILLLDEPTSALDTHAEALVEEALQRLMQGRTVLVVAHRLSTIKSADQVLVMDQGRIVEQGSHPSLMESETLYKRLYERQIEG